MRRIGGIVAALLLAVSAAIWLTRDGESPSTVSPVVAVITPPPGNAATIAVAPPTTARTALPAEAAAPPVANDPSTASLEQALAQRAYDGFGSRLVNYLVRQGLARVDAEPIVVELLGKSVTCALDALRQQAIEQRVDFDQVLYALEAELYDADGPPVSALVDVGAVDRRAMACSTTALTQAGIPPQAAADLFPRNNR